MKTDREKNRFEDIATWKLRQMASDASFTRNYELEGVIREELRRREAAQPNRHPFEAS